jgi:hypothetical protein
VASLTRCNPPSRALLACACLCSSVLAFGQSDQPAPLRREIAASRLLHQAPRTQRLNLSIGLPLRNQAELDALLPQLSDPSSEQFHQYLTPEQFAARFAPSDEDYQALIQFAQQNGLSVTHTHANRAVLSVSGAAADVERAFQVKLMTYTHPTRGEFYAPDREPTMPAGTKALDVMGLDNFTPPKPMGVVRGALAASNPLVTGTGPGGYLIGKDFRTAYAPGVTLTGTGQTVGLLEFDGFFAGDVTKNFAAAGLPTVPVQTVLLDGVSGAAGGDNIEVILDIMMASYMAPGLSRVMVYEGATPNDVLNRMATDNLAQQLSSSWGFGGVNATTEQIFKQYIAQGQSFMQASGDSGAYTNGVMPPSDDPNVTVVGGTSLATSGGNGPWLSETTWSGSGGGVSTTYALPSYQSGVAMAGKGGSTKMRDIPDVALTADIEMYLICDNGAAISVGGTSAAAPLWAGFLALANQQAAASSKPRVGFVNPLIYAIGSSGNYAADFHDITTGSNGFSAVGGYDLATGWGSPAGQHLIYDLTGTSGAPAITASASVAALSLHPSTSGVVSIQVAPQYGFKGTVGLAVTGLPPGVIAAFAPTQQTIAGTAATTSSMTLTVSATAAAGAYPLTVTALSGSVSSTASVVLSVVTPSFTITPSATTITVPRASTGSVTLAIGALNGFTGSVSLSTASLPSGVTASFSPASATAPSKLTFTPGTASSPGTCNVVVNGVSGSLKASTSIALTITVPSFALSVQPVTLALPRGESAAALATITALNGFNSSVAISAAGLPAGVTTLMGTALNGVIPVNFLASPTAVAGSYPITLTGVSGSLSATAKLTLVVVAPSTASTFVDLAPMYNVNAIALDSVAFTGGGLDGGLNGSATAYSASLIGTQQTIAGTVFYFGPAAQLDAVSGKKVALPAGQYASLKLLATGVNGAQAAQSFKVTYTDGTSSTVLQSLSDWFAPASFPGEIRALTMAHRDNGTGEIDNRTFYLYVYSLTLNPAKTVASVTLPGNRNVVVLAATVTGAAPSTTK